eukprot:scaffold75118_cov60-Phaeocystis_antarctica.AAC.3
MFLCFLPPAGGRRCSVLLRHARLKIRYRLGIARIARSRAPFPVWHFLKTSHNSTTQQLLVCPRPTMYLLHEPWELNFLDFRVRVPLPLLRSSNVAHAAASSIANARGSCEHTTFDHLRCSRAGSQHGGESGARISSPRSNRVRDSM